MENKDSIILGVSVYPEQETLEQIDSYLKLASDYGCTKVFTSVFSVDGSRQEVVDYFKNFAAIAHKYGMKVSGDLNAEYFSKLGASETDLSVFREMGLDIIRMDLCFNDERDAILINNKEGIGIEMSTTFVDAIDKALANGADRNNLYTCHNFFPQRYTAPSPDEIDATNEIWKKRHIPVALFITSQQEGTHGPWPVSDGLPTIEEFRQMPVEDQLKMTLTMDNVDEILFGNAFVSEEEFRTVRKYMDAAAIPAIEGADLSFLDGYRPSRPKARVPFTITLDGDPTDLERKIVLDFPYHADCDCMHYLLRSRWSRLGAKDAPLPYRPCEKKTFQPGDVLIVNDNLHRYRGELMIAMKEIENDGQRNYIGHISEADIRLLLRMKKFVPFTFVEE